IESNAELRERATARLASCVMPRATGGNPAANQPPARADDAATWAFSHGIASLFGPAASRAPPMLPEELLEAGMLVYLRGAGLGEGRGRFLRRLRHCSLLRVSAFATLVLSNGAISCLMLRISLLRARFAL